MGQAHKSQHPKLLSLGITKPTDINVTLKAKAKTSFNSAFESEMGKLFKSNGSQDIKRLRRLPFIGDALSHVSDEDIKHMDKDVVVELVKNLYKYLDAELEKVLEHLYPTQPRVDPPSDASTPPQLSTTTL